MSSTVKFVGLAIAVLAFLSPAHGASDPIGCNSEDHGISCCEIKFTPGDNANGNKEKFIQAEEYTTSCIESCKSLDPKPTGITESVKQKYSSGDGRNKNKCWCEFGDAKLDPSNQDYQTCVFNIPSTQRPLVAMKQLPVSERILNPVVLLTGGHTIEINKLTGEYDGSKLEEPTEVFSLWQNESCNKDLDDLPEDRISHSVNFFRGDVIICGGSYPGTRKSCLTLDENQRFVPTYRPLNSWRVDHTAAVVGGKLRIVGGIAALGNQGMESWDGSRWVIQETNLDEIRDLQTESCAATINEDTLLMAGGKRGYGGYGTNKMVSYRNGVWERMEDFPGPARALHSCAFIQTPEGGAFLIAGGQNDNLHSLDSSYLYNIEKRQWEEVGKLPNPRKEGKIIVVDNRVIFLGGEGEHKAIESLNVEEFNVETKTWTTIQQKIKRRRWLFDAVVIPGALVGC